MAYWEKEKIPDNIWLPIIIELANKNFIEVFPAHSIKEGHLPRQAKITFTGIDSINPELVIPAVTEEMRLMKLQIEDLENRPRLRNLDFRRTLISTGLGILLGGLVTWWIQKVEKPIQVFPIIPQITRIVHDTFYIANPKNLKDTSLIRLVKQPHQINPK